jgi:hypothetical protein
VLEEIQAAIRQRVPPNPSPSKPSRPFVASLKRVYKDTKNMSADKDKIKNMERKLRDVMHGFGVRTPLCWRTAASDGLIQIANLIRTDRNTERVLKRMTEFAAAQEVARGEIIHA